MNSFRVVDTRFRILKGGKIGLAASIALIGGMLTLGSTSANATDYFTDIAVSGGYQILVDDRTYGSDNYLQATNYSNNGSYTSNVASTSFDNVVIAPTSFVTDNYTGSVIILISLLNTY